MVIDILSQYLELTLGAVHLPLQPYPGKSQR